MRELISFLGLALLSFQGPQKTFENPQKVFSFPIFQAAGSSQEDCQASLKQFKKFLSSPQSAEDLGLSLQNRLEEEFLSFLNAWEVETQNPWQKLFYSLKWMPQEVRSLRKELMKDQALPAELKPSIRGILKKLTAWFQEKDPEEKEAFSFEITSLLVQLEALPSLPSHAHRWIAFTNLLLGEQKSAFDQIDQAFQKDRLCSPKATWASKIFQALSPFLPEKPRDRNRLHLGDTLKEEDSLLSDDLSFGEDLTEFQAFNQTLLVSLESLGLLESCRPLDFQRSPFTPREQQHLASFLRELYSLYPSVRAGFVQDILKGFLSYLQCPQSFDDELRKELRIDTSFQSPQKFFESLTQRALKALNKRNLAALNDYLSLSFLYGLGVRADRELARTYAETVEELSDPGTQYLSLFKQEQINFQEQWEWASEEKRAQLLESKEGLSPLLENPFISPWTILGELMRVQRWEEAKGVWNRIPRNRHDGFEEIRQRIWKKLLNKEGEIPTEATWEDLLNQEGVLFQKKRSTLDDRAFLTLLALQFRQFRQAIEWGAPLSHQRVGTFCYASCVTDKTQTNLDPAWQASLNILNHPDSTWEDLEQATQIGVRLEKEKEIKTLWEKALQEKKWTLEEQEKIALALERKGCFLAAAEIQGRKGNWGKRGALLERCAEQNQGERKKRFFQEAAQAYEKQAEEETDPLRKSEVLLQAAKQAQEAQNFESAEGFYPLALESLKKAPAWNRELRLQEAQVYQAWGFLYRARREALFPSWIGGRDLEEWKARGRPPFLNLQKLKQLFPSQEEESLSQAREHFLALDELQEYESLVLYGTDNEEDLFLKNESFFLSSDWEAGRLFLRERKQRRAQLLEQAGKGPHGKLNWLIQAAWIWVDLENRRKLESLSSWNVEKKPSDEKARWAQEWPEIYRKVAEASDRKGYDQTAEDYWGKAQLAYALCDKQRDASYAYYRGLQSELNRQRKVYQNIPKAKLPPEFSKSTQIRALLANHSDMIEDRKNEERRKQCSSRIQALERDISASERKLREQGILQ